MKLGRIRPAPRKPAPKKLAPVKPALKKPTPVRPTPVKPTPVRPTPSPGLPRSPDRGNVERNYRGIPGLVNATAPIPRSVKPTPSPGLPPAPKPDNLMELRVDPFQKRGALPPSPPPSGGAPAMGGTFANQLLNRPAPSGGATGSTGFKSAFGGIDSNMLAPSGGVPVNFPGLTGGVGPRPVLQGMKKGGEVKASKASKAPKASSASKRGDGIAIKGKTKGRFV